MANNRRQSINDCLRYMCTILATVSSYCVCSHIIGCIILEPGSTDSATEDSEENSLTWIFYIVGTYDGNMIKDYQ